MSSTTPGQTLHSMLSGWKAAVSDSSSGTGYDLTESNRTAVCRRRVDAFLDSPSEDSFRRLWSDDAIVDYWAPNAAVILQVADDSLEDLAELVAEVRDADAYDPAWESLIDGSGLWELYGRLHADRDPIPTDRANEALQRFRFEGHDERQARIAEIERFRETYEAVVGHATAGTDFELAIYAEVDELFTLVTTTDRVDVNAELHGPYERLYRPLIGFRREPTPSDRIEWTGVEAVVENHLDAKDSGAYDDHTTRHWGGTQIETWKWDYLEYFQEEICGGFDLDSLDADEIEPFFEAISEPDDRVDVVGDVPRKMMGNRFNVFAWNDVVDHCLMNPDDAAATLSTLFDEELPIEDRLHVFYEFASPPILENDRSPGSLLRAATALLMYAYPDRHVNFQYQRFSDFFEAYSTSDRLDTGFSASQYKEVVFACRDLLRLIERYTDDASMLDVQTMIYIGYEA